MKQIKVVKERCIGCGACVAIDPNHFEFDDEGKSNVINNENLESENLINAIESCPTSAIEMTEQDENATTLENEENTKVEENDVCNCPECEEGCNEDTNCHCSSCHHEDLEENENAQ